MNILVIDNTMKKMLYFSLFLMVFVILGAGCDEQKVNINPEVDSNEAELQRISEIEKNVREEMEPIPLEYTKVDTSNWKIYRSSEYGFEFKYPPEGTIFESIEEDALISIKFAPENNPEIGFSAVSRRMLDVMVREIDKPEYRCPTTSEWGTRNMLVETNDYMFCYSEVDDGTAGTMYHLYNYMYYNDDSIINLNFTAPEVNCANYDDDAGCVRINEEEETELFKQIISTFKIN